MLALQIILSYIFEGMSQYEFTKKYVDLSWMLRKHSGELTIYYTDIVRVSSMVILFIPYVFFNMKIVNHLVVKPLKGMEKELKKLDYRKLDERISVRTECEFTELKDEFNNLFERLESSEKQKNLLITSMAHDLKTPITTIRGYSQALIDGIVVDDKQRKEYLNAIHRKSIQLDELITVLFDYSKFLTTQIELNLTEIDLCELIRENLALYYTEFEEKGVNVCFNLPELPVFFQADSRQLSRVFANIYSNALKYNHAGDRVSTTLELSDGIRIIVEDTGDPIPEEVRQHIFEPFVTGDFVRKSGSGTGLGLSIAHKIVELHGGTLELKGKSFIISFSLN